LGKVSLYEGHSVVATICSVRLSLYQRVILSITTTGYTNLAITNETNRFYEVSFRAPARNRLRNTQSS
jgi:hypothetical protein